MLIDDLLSQKPYDLSTAEKEPLFLAAMREALALHRDNSPEYRSFLAAQEFDPEQMKELSEIPSLPVSLFKEIELLSVPRENIKTIVRSSATTTGKPSVIFLDEITIKRQQRALLNIVGDRLGGSRMRFIVFDAASTARRGGEDTSSRSSAIRGFSPFAQSMDFVLTDSLDLDLALLEKSMTRVAPGEKVCFLGFTWLLFKASDALSEAERARAGELLITAPQGSMLVHIGGWKKLTDRAITKKDFNDRMAQFLHIEQENIVDIYGMSEQLGTVYPDCPAGSKHVPLYADILIRNTQTLSEAPLGAAGFIELMTPLPQSYPGVALLSDDIGELRGIDDCPCGRKGKYFVFKKRSEAVPLQGCGDVL